MNKSFEESYYGHRLGHSQCGEAKLEAREAKKLIKESRCGKVTVKIRRVARTVWRPS